MPLKTEQRRAYYGQLVRDRNRSHRDIGAPPKIAKPRRRARCKKSLRDYLLTYHADAFPLPFSPDHEILIEKTQAVLTGTGNVVVAMPRGSGKTTIFSLATIWALLYAHRRFVMLIAAEEDKYQDLHNTIKLSIEHNELLYEDFPEVVHPVRELDGVVLRANYQLCDGEPTNLKWSTSLLQFADTPYTRKHGNHGAMVKGGGITSSKIRGTRMTLKDGTVLRPDAVLIDDPQTRESAKSLAQTQQREDVIKGDIKGMAGPGKSIATMCACTVIYPADLAERLLDRERSPTWDALRVSRIKSWPKQLDLWEKHDAILRQERFGELPAGSANAFYSEHREQMDAGGQVYWEDRRNAECISALQAAMIDYYESPATFMSEMQNNPEEAESGELERLNPLKLVRRQSHLKRNEVPVESTAITAHIDVQGKLLYWMVCAWTSSCRGYVIDYGTTPEQRRDYFSLLDIKKDLRKSFPGNDEAGALRAAIASTVTYLADRTWHREDGAEVRLNRGLVDGRWRTVDVHQALKIAGRGNWTPALGTGIGAKDLPMALYTKRQGIQFGNHYMIHKPDRRQQLVVSFDTNFWKTELHQALTVAPEHSSSVLFFQAEHSKHQLVADHICAEKVLRVSARNRIVDEWSLPSTSPDNHYWDNLVGCRVAAAMCGILKDNPTHVRRTTSSGKRRVRQLGV